MTDLEDIYYFPITTLNVQQSIATTFNGTIADGPSDLLALSLGSGTLTLSGTNTFTGGTTVAGGTLILTNNEALADGSSLTVGDASAFAPAAVVPEPGTIMLLAAGMMLLVVRGLRRR